MTVNKYHCCIPGCTTYDTLHNFLKIPVETNWRNEWLSVIPRKNWVVDHSTIACVKHFKNADLTIYSTVTTDRQGKQHTTSNVTPIITNKGAVPFYYPKSNSENNPNEVYAPQEMFELYPRDCTGPETFEDIENIKTTDFIVDYWYLKLSYPKRLETFLDDTWKATTTVEHIIFYTTDFSETPRIPVSVKIDNHLRVKVTLAGRNMDPADLTWVLPVSGKINRWSQLQIMLTIYGQN